MDDASLLELCQQAVRNVNTVQQTFQSNAFLSDHERGYVRRFPGQHCWPLMSRAGVGTGAGNTASSSSLPSSPSATQLSANDLRAKRLAFYGGAAAATAANTSSSAAAGCAGSSDQKKRKQRPPAASTVAAHSAATAIDLLGDSSSDDDCKPAAIKKKSPPPTTDNNNKASVEIIEID
jgi:hypothetical protein